MRRNLRIPPFRYALQRKDRIWQLQRFKQQGAVRPIEMTIIVYNMKGMDSPWRWIVVFTDPHSCPAYCKGNGNNILAVFDSFSDKRR